MTEGAHHHHADPRPPAQDGHDERHGGERVGGNRHDGRHGGPPDGAGAGRLSGDGRGAPASGIASEPRFERIVFVGIGLINGSLARDVRRLGLADRTVAVARRQGTVERAVELGLVDEATTDAAAAVRGADLVVLGVPVGASGEAAAALAGSLRPDAIVTDVGSVKARVIELVAPHLDMRRFVPGHPVAGTESSGPDAALEGLYEGRWCILTPDHRTDADAVARVEALWRAVGAKVERMDAEHHDRVLAVTSHLPHLLAFNLINTAGSIEAVLEREVLKYAAGGFTDLTRIAASDPTLWRDVFLHNRDAVLEIVGRYIEDLVALQRVIRWKEGDALLERFASAQAIRREVARAGQSYQRCPAVPPKPADPASDAPAVDPWAADSGSPERTPAPPATPAFGSRAHRGDGAAFRPAAPFGAPARRA